MPDIKFQHIVSFNSEDKNHPAENLLKPGGSHKWKGANPGEKQISAVIQLEKASQIYSIDIGNEGSAFVEVLVGRSSSTTDHDFEVLLVSSSFMSPMESRNGTNKNSVRIFGSDKLSKTTASQKWDRVKIVCTQPFNKTSTYGLSFLTLHSPEEPGEKSSTKDQGAKTLGAFRLKAEAEEKGSVKVGTLFAKYEHEKTHPPPLTGAAAIRAASKLAEESKESKSPSAKNVTTTPSSTQKRKFSGSDDESVKPSLAKVPLRKQTTSVSSTSSRKEARETPPPLKKTKSEPPKPSPAKEFCKLMEKVVFVLSGYTNPRRGEVRDRALKMGAKYKSDWVKTCTHLVCAFANTPKYNQVRGKGKIVTHHWINDCYKTKKLLDWKDYRCGDAETPSDSDEEEEEITQKKKSQKTTISEEGKHKISKPVAVVDDNDGDYSGDTDMEDSGENTEDELRKLDEMQEKAQKKKETPQKEADPYGESTDEDEPKKRTKTPTKPPVVKHDDSDSGLPELPDFFTDKNFFLYGDFPAPQRRLLVRYITAFNGELCEYMTDNVNFVLTNSSWDENFDEALSESPSIVFIKPKWIFACNEKNKLVPYQPFVVVPQG